MTDLLTSAVSNNADWCDAICRSHGLQPARGGSWWRSPVRTPPFYPDAISLSPNASPDELISAIDLGAGCSVKDSFADLNLSDLGFQTLFEARWIGVEVPVRPTPPAGFSWSVVTPGQLAGWEQHWLAGGESLATQLFRPELLTDPRVALVSVALSGKPVGGFAVNRSGSVAGISNLHVFDETVDPSTFWPAALAAASEVMPASAVVGYESGDDLRHATEAGFTELGPLRVWLAPS